MLLQDIKQDCLFSKTLIVDGLKPFCKEEWDCGLSHFHAWWQLFLPVGSQPVWFWGQFPFHIETLHSTSALFLTQMLNDYCCIWVPKALHNCHNRCLC